MHGYARNTSETDACEQSECDNGPMGYAASSLAEARQLHAQLDDLETRLFGPEPRELTKGVAGAPQGEPLRPALLPTVRDTANTLGHATSRLARVLGRL